MVDKKWISKHGFILPHSSQEQSENGVLFSVEYAFLLEENCFEESFMFENKDIRDFNQDLSFSIYRLWSTQSDNEYRTIPLDDNPRFSLDNAIAVGAYCRRYNYINWNKENLDALSLFRKHSLRPDTFCFLLYCKYPLIGWWFLWVVSISMLWTCAKPSHDTSGKNLAFVRYMGADMYWTWKLCLKIMNNPLSQWKIYFPESGHPTPLLAESVYGYR